MEDYQLDVENLFDLDELTDQLANMRVMDDNRAQQNMEMPPIEMVLMFKRVMEDILELAPNQKYVGTTFLRQCVAFFGGPPVLLAKVWELLEETGISDDMPRGFKPKHLCWGFAYLKLYHGEVVMCKLLGKPTEKTLRKWVWECVYAIRDLEFDVIKWENRKRNDVGYDCLVSVDGTDFKIPQIKVKDPSRPGKKLMNKSLYCYKHNGPGLRYEVAISILNSDIVHIAGPFCPGDMNDRSIFKSGLMQKLDPGERVEADAGYGNDPEHVKCKDDGFQPEEQIPIRKAIEGRHETVNAFFKSFGCLNQTFRPPRTADMDEVVEKHGALFRAVAVITQVAMELGIKHLFDLDLTEYS